MTTQPFRPIGWMPARTVASSVVALLSIALCGCGISIPTPSADSTSSDSGDTAGDMSIASNDNAGRGAAGMAAGTDDSSTAGAETDPALRGVDDETYAGAGAVETPDMHGAAGDELAGSDPASLGQEQDMEALRAQFEEQNGAEGAFPEEDLEAMRAQFEQEAGAGVAGVEADPANREAGGALGQEGFDGDRGGSSRAGQFEEGSAPYVVMLMVEAVNSGDLETAAKYITEDADGALGSVRDGSVGENQLRELQSYFATMEPLSLRAGGRSLTLNFNGGQSKVLRFVVVKEGREFQVDSMTVHDAGRR